MELEEQGTERLFGCNEAKASWNCIMGFLYLSPARLGGRLYCVGQADLTLLILLPQSPRA